MKGLTSVSYHQISPNARLSKKADLRIRDLPEWQSAIIFDPDQTDLRMINMTSRLIIELCDGRSLSEIEEQYCSLVSGHVDADTARKQFGDGLGVLQEHGLMTVQ